MRFEPAQAKQAHSPARRVAELSSCGQHGLAVKPRQGDALLFWSMTLDGNTVRCAHSTPQGLLCLCSGVIIQDSTSLHASCPVIRGEKWTGACACALALSLS